MRLLIIGAAGFIGGHLTRKAAAAGYDVVALSRAGSVAGFSGPHFIWELGQPLPPMALDGVSCAIYLAHDFGGEKGAALTVQQTLACVEQLRRHGVGRQLFFSSYSAGAYAISLYGRTKFEIERAVTGLADLVIVRPGLVLGDGGIYGRIRKWAQKFPLVPLPDGGRLEVPVISIHRLCDETLALASAPAPPREANLFEQRLVTLRELVDRAASEVGRHPLIVPVPSMLLLWGLRAMAALRIPSPVNADNLVGLLASQNAGHLSILPSGGTEHTA